MITIDYLIIGVVLVSMIVGFFRGFFPELVSIATWIAAIFFAWHFSDLLQPYLQGKLGSVVAELWAARLILFVITLVLGGLIGQLVSLLIDKTGLSGTDRMLGLVFGIVRGGVIVGVLVIMGQLLGFNKESWWPESTLIPVGEKIADTLRLIVPEAVTDLLENGAPPEEQTPADLPTEVPEPQ